MPLYVILAYGTLLSVLAIPFTLAIIVFNRTYIATISCFVQLLINVVGNFIFIPRYGIMGAAYTFAASSVVMFMWSLVWALYLMKKKDFNIT